MGRRDLEDHEHCAITDGQARGRGGARRDLHHSRREGRHPQHHELRQRGRARARLVARRQVDLLLFRPVGRVRARHRVAGRHHRPARDSDSQREALLHAILVARLEEASLHRYRPHRVGDGHRERPAQGARQRSVGGALTHPQPDMESRFEVGGLRVAPQHALSRHLRRERGDGREEADHRRSRRRDVPGVGSEREVSVVPRVHRFRPEVAVARHDLIRSRGELRPVPRGPEERRGLSAASRKRRGQGRAH